MHVFIVYCHPSMLSFTCQLKDRFIRGLLDAGHTFELSDLYTMGFQSDLTEKEYLREAFYREELPVAEDVLLEQQKIQRADAIAFVYPVFWTEAPAKLVGWFDRVWTCGFAYGDHPTMKRMEKALFLVSAGNTQATLEEQGRLDAMKSVMLTDRIQDRAKEKELVIFESTSHDEEETREKKIPGHLRRAYELGKNF